VLEASQVWRATVTRLASDYPDVTLSHLYVDAASMLLIQYPKDFDVVVAENLFGDILSDEVGAIAGSLGLLPSASLGEGPGLYEPVHGSAPALAGKDVANPAGTILSAALLLRHSLKREAAAAVIERAVEQVIRDGIRTVDIAGGGASVGCRAFTTAVLARL
jgi:3-isopropylmalate dehydrogenase